MTLVPPRPPEGMTGFPKPVEEIRRGKADPEMEGPASTGGYDLKESKSGVRELYPVLYDAHGNGIDGFHRLEARLEELEGQQPSEVEVSAVES